MVQVSLNFYGKVLINEWVQVDAPCAQKGNEKYLIHLSIKPKYHIILLSKNKSRLANKSIQIKLVSSGTPAAV